MEEAVRVAERKPGGVHAGKLGHRHDVDAQLQQLHQTGLPEDVDGLPEAPAQQLVVRQHSLLRLPPQALIRRGREATTTRTGEEQIVLLETSPADPLTQARGEPRMERNRSSLSLMASCQLARTTRMKYKVTNSQRAGFTRTKWPLGHGDEEEVHRTVVCRVLPDPIKQRPNLRLGKYPFLTHCINEHSDELLQGNRGFTARRSARQQQSSTRSPVSVTGDPVLQRQGAARIRCALNRYCASPKSPPPATTPSTPRFT